MPTGQTKARFFEPMLLQRTDSLPKGANWGNYIFDRPARQCENAVTIGSGIEHLAKTLWPCSRWGKCIFAMYTACFDASGTERDTQFLVFGGFVSTSDYWIKFSQDWKER